MNVYETTINHVTVGDEKDPYVIIETTEKTVISALEGRGRFTIVEEDNTKDMPRLVRFQIPISEVNWAGLAKRKGSPRPHLSSVRPKAKN